MEQQRWLAERFEENRGHLRAVAIRVLGSPGEAEDAVQEAWLRLSRSQADDIDNLRAWLTTVVGRVCLDMLRSRSARREEPLEPSGQPLLEVVELEDEIDPEQEALLADSVGLALHVVLDQLAPVERVAFVLHDIFGVPFAQISSIVGRSPAATRMLASRARRRVQDVGAHEIDQSRQREVVEAFLAASRRGDFNALLELLDPDVVLRADPAAVRAASALRDQGAPPLEAELHDITAVARVFTGRVQAAQPALINGSPGAAWAVEGRARAAFVFAFADCRIAAIDVIYDPQRIRDLDITLFLGV